MDKVINVEWMEQHMHGVAKKNTTIVICMFHFKYLVGGVAWKA